VDKNTKQEKKLLDYQTQQFKLTPALATCFVMHFASINLVTMYQTTIEQFNKDDYSNLEAMHHLLAGFKSLNTGTTLPLIDVCRQACGGAGFLSAAGF
jgi:hypothetical protein